MKSILTNLGLLLASVLFGLVALEALCWLVAPPPKPDLPVGLMVRGPAMEWRLSPNFHGIMDNRVDFQDAEIHADGDGRRIVPAAPATAPHRLWVLGDSQTFGHGVSDEQAWPNRLQERLNQRGVAIKVLNLGVPGINIDQYLARIQAIASGIAPGDTVLIGVSWNDIITPPPTEPVQQAVVAGHLVSAQAAAPENRDSTEARIKFYEWSGIVVPPLQDLKSVLDALSQTSALVGVTYPRLKAIYYRLRRHTPIATMVAQKVPEANFALLSAIRSIVEGRGARLVVALLAERMFFEDDAYRVFSVDGRDYPTQDYMASLAEPLCRDAGIDCLNVFPLLHHHQAEAIVFRIDGHFNAKGTALLGPWLADRIYPP